MTPPKKETRRHISSFLKKKRARKTHLQRLQFYAVITGMVGLLMTIVRLVISLIR